MKASELIKRLEDKIARDGDVEVMVGTGYGKKEVGQVDDCIGYRLPLSKSEERWIQIQAKLV